MLRIHDKLDYTMLCIIKVPQMIPGCFIYICVAKESVCVHTFCRYFFSRCRETKGNWVIEREGRNGGKGGVGVCLKINDWCNKFIGRQFRVLWLLITNGLPINLQL